MISLIVIKRDNLHLFIDQILNIERGSFPTPWRLNAFTQEVRNPNSYLWALVVDGFLAAYICFWMVYLDVQLLNLAVHPKNRNQGLASLLITRMIGTGKKNKMKHIWLEVRPSNTTAQALYLKFGFEKVGLRRGYYQDTKEDAILMTRRLFKNRADSSIAING